MFLYKPKSHKTENNKEQQKDGENPRLLFNVANVYILVDTTQLIYILYLSDLPLFFFTETSLNSTILITLP